MRFEHNLFCKNETEDYVLHICRTYGRTDAAAAQITLLETNFCTVCVQDTPHKVLFTEEM